MKNSTCMSKAFPRRMVVWTGIVMLFGVLFAFYPPAASGTKPDWITIETLIQLPAPAPFSGTFVVSEGASILGCSGGEFEDTFQGNLKKTFTCLTPTPGGAEVGDTFTVRFETWVGWSSGGNANDHWRVVDGTGYFATLHGQGDFFLEVFGGLPPTHAIETLMGNVHFDP